MFSTWVKHSCKHQHATAGSQSRKQALSHFTLLHTKSFASFPATMFHNLCALLGYTTFYSPQLSSSHSQSNYMHKSAFLDRLIAMNLYILKDNCLRKFSTGYLYGILSMYVCIRMYVYINTHIQEVAIRSTDARELISFYDMNRPSLKSCPVW